MDKQATLPKPPDDMRGLLRQLYDLSPVMLQNRAASPKYNEIATNWQINLNEDGTVDTCTPTVDIVPTAKGAKRQVLKKFLLPRKPSRTTAIRANLLADKADYALGAGPQDDSPVSMSHLEGSLARFNNFRDLVGRCYEETGSSDVGVALKFLQSWVPGREPLPVGFEPKILEPMTPPVGDKRPNYPFVLITVDWRIPSDDPAVVRFWEKQNAAEVAEQPAQGGAGILQCLITGEFCKPQQRTTASFPFLGSRMNLVSMNSEAYESYGLKNAHNAPMDPLVAEQIALTLESMMARPDMHTRIGDMELLHWGDDGIVRELLNGQEGKDESGNQTRSGKWVEDQLQKLYEGKLPQASKGHRFAVYGISRNMGRYYINDFAEVSAQNAFRHIRAWGLAGRVGVCTHPKEGEDADAGDVWSYRGYSLFRMAHSLIPEGVKGPSRDKQVGRFVREMLLACLRGEPMPVTIRRLAVHRNIIEASDMAYERLALIQTAIMLDAESDPERRERVADKMTTVDPSNEDLAYLCGRLFAYMDYLQYKAMDRKLNVSLASKYFRAVSMHPKRVLANLTLMVESAYVRKLKRDSPKYGIVVGYIKLRNRIHAGDIPIQFDLRQQELFQAGFYQEKALGFSKGALRKNTPDQDADGGSDYDETNDDTNIEDGE